MRIVGGELRHRQVSAPPGWTTRPTSDRLRTTLFDILGPEVRGRIFVDAYAGTGAVGLEAASRGASAVFWIESEPKALACLRANLAALSQPQGRRTVIARPAVAALPRLAGLLPSGCDYFFLDPPYDDNREYERILAALGRAPGLIADGGRLIVECRRGMQLPAVAGFEHQRITTVGDGQLMFLRTQP